MIREVAADAKFLLLTTAVALAIMFLVSTLKQGPVQGPVIVEQKNEAMPSASLSQISCIEGYEITSERDTEKKIMKIGVTGQPERNAKGGPVVPRHPRVIVCTTFGEE